MLGWLRRLLWQVRFGGRSRHGARPRCGSSLAPSTTEPSTQRVDVGELRRSWSDGKSVARHFKSSRWSPRRERGTSASGKAFERNSLKRQCPQWLRRMRSSCPCFPTAAIRCWTGLSRRWLMLRLTILRLSVSTGRRTRSSAAAIKAKPPPRTYGKRSSITTTSSAVFSTTTSLGSPIASNSMANNLTVGP